MAPSVYFVHRRLPDSALTATTVSDALPTNTKPSTTSGDDCM
jgi:hypothetical protein